MKYDMYIRFVYALDIDHLTRLSRRLTGAYENEHYQLSLGRTPKIPLFLNDIEKEAITYKLKIMATDAAIRGQPIPPIVLAILDMEEKEKDL